MAVNIGSAVGNPYTQLIRRPISKPVEKKAKTIHGTSRAKTGGTAPGMPTIPGLPGSTTTTPQVAPVPSTNTMTAPLTPSPTLPNNNVGDLVNPYTQLNGDTTNPYQNMGSAGIAQTAPAQTPPETAPMIGGQTLPGGTLNQISQPLIGGETLPGGVLNPVTQPTYDPNGFMTPGMYGPPATTPDPVTPQVPTPTTTTSKTSGNGREPVHNKNPGAGQKGGAAGGTKNPPITNKPSVQPKQQLPPKHQLLAANSKQGLQQAMASSGVNPKNTKQLMAFFRQWATGQGNNETPWGGDGGDGSGDAGS